MSARSPLICSAVELWYKKMLKIGSLSELTGIDTKIKVAGFQRLYSKWLWLLMAVYKPSFAEQKYKYICILTEWSGDRARMGIFVCRMGGWMAFDRAVGGCGGCRRTENRGDCL